MTAIIAKKINETVLEAFLFLLGKLESRHKQCSLGHQPQGEHALQIRMCHHQHKQHISTSQGFTSLISSFRRLILFELGNSRHTQIKVSNSGD